MKAERRQYSAPALEKGLDILELLATEENGLTQAEIARTLDRSVSEIFRMLVVLQERGYLAQDPDTDRYGLTTLLFEVAHRTPSIKRLTALAGPLMRKLARGIRQSVHLTVLSGDAVLVVGQVDPPANNILSVRLGARIELWRASSGRVILAHLPEEELAENFARHPLPPGMAEARLREEFVAIRARGHEITDSFVLRGIVNIAVPVFDHNGHPVAGLTIPYLERYDDSTPSKEACLEAIAEVARSLTRSLGGGRAAPAAPPPLIPPEPRLRTL